MYKIHFYRKKNLVKNGTKKKHSVSEETHSYVATASNPKRACILSFFSLISSEYKSCLIS